MAAANPEATTAQPQMSVPRFVREQLLYKPEPVHDVDLKGKTIIVTGSNTGVGFELSSQLLALGPSKLILAVRSPEKGNAAANRLSLKHSVPDGVVVVWPLDLSSYDSVAQFAEKTKRLERMDYVVLNAGVALAERVFNDKTGHDEMIQVNFISTALLALLLLPVIQEKRAAQEQPTRITFTSSEAASWTSFSEKSEESLLAALDKPGKVDMLDRMFVSKLLGQFFIHKLASVVPPSVALINAASPGSVHDSEFNREHDKTFSGAIAKIFMKRVTNTAAVGARLMADAVVHHGEDTHGLFLSFTKPYLLAPIIYTPKGQDIEEQLWTELIEEFGPFQVSRILKEIPSK